MFEKKKSKKIKKPEKTAYKTQQNSLFLFIKKLPQNGPKPKITLFSSKTKLGATFKKRKESIVLGTTYSLLISRK